MDLKEAKLILEEIKDLDDSIFQYAPGYLEALETVLKPQWIPVTERLPEKGTVVLITNKKGHVGYGKYRGIYLMDNVNPYWYWKGNTLEHVIAWMPLPEPYREDV